MTSNLFPSAKPNPSHLSSERALAKAVEEFWPKYYKRMEELHSDKGRARTQPLKDRNLGTTAAEHVKVFESFWSRELAQALGVPLTEVGPRRIRFNAYRSKQFDVCWPLTGEPRIVISVKSMQNAYRNMTNRVEEALGDSAILRLYEKPAAFGFFFFVLDGVVARGKAEIGDFANLKEVISDPKGKRKPKGVKPHLCLVEEGGDFFDLTDCKSFSVVRKRLQADRQDVIALTDLSLLDLASKTINPTPALHYDAIGYLPATIRRNGEGWSAKVSAVNPLLDPRALVGKLIQTAQARKLL